MRCLLIAPYGVDLSVLREVLAEESLAPTATEDIGSGILLADVEMRDFNAAIVILPDGHTTAGLAAVLVESGIAAARGLPLLAVVPPEQSPPTALASVRHVKGRLDNREALRLHARLFVRSLNEQPKADVQATTRNSSRPSPAQIAQFRERL